MSGHVKKSFDNLESMRSDSESMSGLNPREVEQRGILEEWKWEVHSPLELLQGQADEIYLERVNGIGHHVREGFSFILRVEKEVDYIFQGEYHFEDETIEISPKGLDREYCAQVFGDIRSKYDLYEKLYHELNGNTLWKRGKEEYVH